MILPEGVAAGEGRSSILEKCVYVEETKKSRCEKVYIASSRGESMARDAYHAHTAVNAACYVRQCKTS